MYIESTTGAVTVYRCLCVAGSERRAVRQIRHIFWRDVPGSFDLRQMADKKCPMVVGAEIALVEANRDGSGPTRRCN